MKKRSMARIFRALGYRHAIFTTEDTTMKTTQTIIRTASGYRGAILRNGLTVAISTDARNNRNDAARDALKLSQSV